MSDYLKWLRNQPEKFQRIIVKDSKKAHETFVDENYIPISLEQLKELDEEFNFNDED